MAKHQQPIGARILRYRLDRDMTQQQLADASGVASSYIARIEVGKRRPTLDVLERLAAALRVPLARLFADDQASRASPGFDGWSRPAKQLAQMLVDLADADIELLTKLAQRLRR